MVSNNRNLKENIAPVIGQKEERSMRLRSRIKECQLVVKARMSLGESLDENSLEQFQRARLRGFMAPTSIKRTTVEYVGPIGISLYERMMNPIGKWEFLFIMEQIVAAVQNLAKNKLLANRMVLDLQNVYINEVTKEIQFLYIPTSRDMVPGRLQKLFEDIIYSAKPGEEKDQDFVARFAYFYKGMSALDMDKLEKFIQKEEPGVVSLVCRQWKGRKHLKGKTEHYSGSDSDEYDTDLLDEDEDEYDTDLLSEDGDSTTLLSEDNDEDATGLLVECEHYPTLLRVGTEETISIDQAVFRLGKERNCVDYCVTGNTAVSRRHMDMIMRGQEHFVKDLGSKNHTYLNGEMLEPQIEVPIRDGDRLKLADEEFVFCE